MSERSQGAELPEVWEGAEAEERSYLPSGLADVYEGPDIEEVRETARPTEAGAGLANIYEAVRRSEERDDADDEKEDGISEPSAEEAGSGDSPFVRVERDPVESERQAADDLARPDVTFIHHVVVPGATIALVGSMLFYLLDLRSAFVSGSISLKWIGLCFVVATVLIARYSRLMGRWGYQSVYTVFLGAMTFLAMSMSPWEPPQTKVWGPLLNGVVLVLVWRFATLLTHNLSADLDDTSRRRRTLFGLERLALETWRRQQQAEGKKSYRIRRGGGPEADSEAALRSVAGWVLLGLMLFALGEPILLLAPPEVAPKALTAMVWFLLSAAILLAAASTAAQQRRLRRLQAAAAWTVVTGRVVSALALVVLVLALALQLPGVHLVGRGALEPNRQGGSGSSSDSDQVSEPAEADGEGPREEPPGEGGEPPAEGGAQGDRKPPSASGFDLVTSLADLGRFLLWPVLGLIAALLLVAAVRRVGRQEKLALASLWRGLGGRARRLWAVAWKRMGRRIRPGKRRRDPFVEIGVLRRLDSDRAVVGAYAVLQAALADLGYARSAEQTPIEYLRNMPGVFARLRPAADRLTRLYLHTAYSPAQIGDAQRTQALEALEELRLTACTVTRFTRDSRV